MSGAWPIMSFVKCRHLAQLKKLCRFRSYQEFIRIQGTRTFASEVQQDSSSSSSDVQSSTKLRTNTPIAKNFYLGTIDPDVFVFPEIDNNEELEELEQMIAPVEKFFNEGLDSQSIDVNAKISDEVLQQIKDLGLFGQQVPTEYGGLGLNATKYARLAEIISLDGSVAVTLSAHQSIGLKGILIAGTDEQKAKYLPKLATGEHIAAFALTEPSSGSDAASIQTTATLSDDGKTFLLNGGKIWISNGGIADIFTVFARTNVKNERGDSVEKISAFIVERAFGGVTTGKPEDKLGIRGSNTCDVHFDNTPIPVENVLGELGGGFKVAMNILNTGRFSMGSAGAGVVKKLIGMTAEHAIARKQFGKSLREFGLIQEKFANMAIQAYAMESLTYFTSGIIDQYEEPDMSVEVAMVKVFSSESCWTCVNDALQVLGGLGYMKDYPYERILRDARILLIFEGTNEILRLFIGLQGILHAAGSLQEVVKKMRSPMSNPGFLLKKGVERMNKNRRKPFLSMRLFEHVHPQLSFIAEEFEIRLYRLQSMVEQYLSLYANTMIDEQLAVKRLADIGIDLFAMLAVMSHASRSMSIGLKNCEHEIELASAFCYFANKRIDDNLEALAEKKHKNGDEVLKKIAEKTFESHGYAPVHPLTRNW